MPTRTLTIENIASVPFASFVQKEITRALQRLTATGVLQVDLTGGASGDYTLTFVLENPWRQGANRDRCWYRPRLLGMSGDVYVGALMKWNHCTDVSKCSTCEPVFRRKQSELGWAIVNTALHELGHVFGLSTKNSYKGADPAGHTGDRRNFMFDYARDPAYKRLKEDSGRTKEYVIRERDNLSTIARRIGFRHPYGSWKTLWAFRGRDGKTNRERLRSKDPNLIFPGEVLWVPDVLARNEYFRSVECFRKEFTKTQIDFMARWIKQGSSLLQIQSSPRSGP
jgi:hypothetical protein